ncbi:MAG: TylF/MycF/NovP-related O-methyltransferase [Candidatus Omnitrophota bacterium]|jgi:hypothetical protein
MNFFSRTYRILVQFLCVPILVSDFFCPRTGHEYGVTFWTKLKLLVKMMGNNSRILSGSSFIEHIIMATTLLNTPKDIQGCVVECGTYKGVSATNMSLICGLVGRRFKVFDSFEGLPEPAPQDAAHEVLDIHEVHAYQKGWWAGSLEEVRSNITRYGNINVCDFYKGFFDTTLPHFNEPCVQIFLDVDYVSSLETCLIHLWPLLRNGGYLYTHEAQHTEISRLFYSEGWWQKNLKTEPPGLVGAGTGLGLKILTGSHFTSALGYIVKNPQLSNFQKFDQVGGLKLDFSATGKLTKPGAMFKGEKNRAN